MAGKSGSELTLCFQPRVDCWQSGPVSPARSQVSCLHVLRSVSSLGTSAVCLTPDCTKPPAPAFLSLCHSQGTIVFTSLAQKVVSDSLSCWTPIASWDMKDSGSSDSTRCIVPQPHGLFSHPVIPFSKISSPALLCPEIRDLRILLSRAILVTVHRPWMGGQATPPMWFGACFRVNSDTTSWDTASVDLYRDELCSGDFCRERKKRLEIWGARLRLSGSETCLRPGLDP